MLFDIPYVFVVLALSDFILLVTGFIFIYKKKKSENLMKLIVVGGLMVIIDFISIMIVKDNWDSNSGSQALRVLVISTYTILIPAVFFIIYVVKKNSELIKESKKIK